MSNTKVQKLKQEFEEIMKKNKGFISPESVVEYGKNKHTYIHSKLTWDDSEAGHKYRLIEAGCLIRSVKVEIVMDKQEDRVVKIRGLASLPADRGRGGYRKIEKILDDNDLKIQYIDSVRDELEAVQKKLETISAIAFKKAESIRIELNKERDKLIKKRQAV